MKIQFKIKSLSPLYLGVMLAFGVSLAPLAFNHLDVPLGAAMAADKVETKDTLRPELIKILQPTQELLKTQNYKEALAKIAESDAITDKTPFETYIVESLRGTAAQGAGDLDVTAAAFDKVFATGRMPAAQQVDVMLALAGQFYNKKDYAKAITWANRHIKEGGKDPQIHQLLFLSYYQTDDLTNAGKELEWMVQEDEKAGRVPSQDNLSNLAGIYQEQKNETAYIAVVEKLATLYPKKDYWGNLINAVLRKQTYAGYLDLNMYRLQQMTDNVSKASQYREWAQIALQDTHAMEAKKALDLGYKTGLMGTGADAAKDKILRDTVEKKAAIDLKALAEDEKQVAKNKEGTGLVNVGLNYLAIEQYDKAIALIEQGLAKGGLKHTEGTKLELGYAYLMSGKKDKAIEIFKSVQGTDGAADLAHIWLIKANQKN